MLGRALATGAMAATLFLVPAETAQAHVFAGCAGNKAAPFGVTDANSCVNPEDLAFADYCIRTLGHSLNANPSQAKRDAQAGANLPNHIICEGDAAVFPADPGDCGIYASRQETNIQLGTRQIFCAPKLKSGETECPPGLQHSPESHECTWPQPVAVRVDADLANEMFTLSWRAPQTTATIIGYHIRRSQNLPAVVVGQNARPTRCDELTENQFKRSDNGAARSDYSFLNGGITVVAADVFTVTVRTARPTNPQESYGSCYRWHIAAFTEQRGGAEAVTDPILSRSNAGRDGCDAGEAKPWISDGTGGGVVYGDCTPYVEGGEWCARQGGTLITTGGVYQCSTSAACSGGGFVEASSGVCDLTSGGVCGAFSEFSLEQRECQCVGFATEKSRSNNGAQECECLDPEFAGTTNCAPAATCPDGEVRVEGMCVEATPVNLCKNLGWTVTMVSGGQVCAGFSLADGSDKERAWDTQCRFDAQPANVPACSEVFGSPPVFPQNDGTDRRFVYNCDADPNVPRGLIPATANTVEAEECSCADAGSLRLAGIPHNNDRGFFVRGACVADNGGGSFMGTSLGGLCALNGWTLTSEGGGKCRIPVSRAGGQEVNGCFIAGSNTPQCVNVFGRQGRETGGDDLATIFPASPEGEVVYVYDCGEGFAPETLNMGGEQECMCASLEGVTSGTCDCPAATHYEFEGACFPKTGGFGNVRQETLCTAFGGTAEDEGAGGRVCKGLDKAGTFCFLDSAEVFPCRGLFKHLRTCNLLYQRPALNPFVCDEKCPGGANGKGMGCADG